MSYRRTGTFSVLVLLTALLLISAYFLTRPAGEGSKVVGTRGISGTVSDTPAYKRIPVKSFTQSPSANAAEPKTGRPVAQWIQTAIKKRDSSAPPEAHLLFQEGIALLETGNYREARKSLQRLINQRPDSKLMSYAFLAIAESHRMEGGDCLSQAAIQYQDFLVFFPNSELAPYARQRFVELEPILKEQRRQHQQRIPQAQ